MIKVLDPDWFGSSWHARSLGDDYRYVMFDGIYLKRRSTCSLFRECSVKQKRVVLVAYGFKTDGSRELIEFRIVDKENKENWTAFLTNLRMRGLNGKHLELITTDEHKGLLSAVQTVWPNVRHQVCWFHKSSNVLKCIRKMDRKEAAKDLRSIYKAPTRKEAMKAFGEFRNKWNEMYPDAVKRLEQVLENLLNVFLIAPADRKAVRTTNVIERTFREVRKRTRPIGCFMNDMSISRVILATFEHYNARQSKIHKPGKMRHVAA